MSRSYISLITLGVADVARARIFYRDGFGWKPVFETEEVVFFQMNGLVFALWDKAQLEADMERACPAVGSFALAHNVESAEAVDRLVERLVASGAQLLRAPDAPPHGGYRGYVADPDGNAWEIAWNPAWRMDEAGHTIFAL